MKKPLLFLKKINKKFLAHNAGYRIFIIIVYTIIFLIYGAKGNFGDMLISFTCVVGFLTFSTLYLIDKEFKYDISLPAKDSKNPNAITPEEFSMFKQIIKDFFTGYIPARMINLISRLPGFENLGRGTIANYRHRKIRLFNNYFEEACPGVLVTFVNLDNYYCVLSLSSVKSLTTKNVQDNIKSALEKHFSDKSQNILLRLKTHKGKLLIPIEYLKN